MIGACWSISSRALLTTERLIAGKRMLLLRGNVRECGDDAHRAASVPPARADLREARKSADRSATRLRVAFLSPVDSSDPNALSGMPYRMRSHLEDRGLEVVPLHRTPLPDRLRIIPDPVRSRTPAMAKKSWRSLRQAMGMATEWSLSRPLFRKRLRHTHKANDAVSAGIEAVEPDVLFGVCISTMLYELNTSRPIVYFSDATARLINDTYPKYRWRSPGYRRLCDIYESHTMARVHTAAFASQAARDSAVNEYGLIPQCAHVVPMGANIVPHSDAFRNGESVDAPSRDDLRLCIIAADPIRKRVDFAVEVTERLAHHGWNARLTHIGEPTRRAARSPVTQCLGRLRLSESADRARCEQILRESHLMLLPSIGEAYGIAPCEAAHFGRPSVVSDAGGLPEVVINNRTGLVLPVHASAATYATAIANLALSRSRYLTMASAARSRATTVLNWSAWTDRIVELLEAAAADGSAQRV